MAIEQARLVGGRDFGAAGDPRMMDLGEAAARITNVGLGEIARSSGPQVIREGFEDAASLTARWNVYCTGAGTVTIGTKSYAGVGSAKFLTGAVLNNHSDIYRYLQGYPSKYGLEVAIGIVGQVAANKNWRFDAEFYVQPSDGSACLDATLRLVSNPDGTYDFGVTNGATGAFTSFANGIILSQSTELTWHYMKLTVDVPNRRYGYCWLDNLKIDPAAINIDNGSVLGNMTFTCYPTLTLRTLAAQAATVYADDVIVTRDEA